MLFRKGVAKIKILDEVNCAVLGVRGDHVETLYDEFSRFVPNYFFNPRYKLKQWDGKVHYFKKTGKTYVYLLDEIIKRLKTLGYKFELIDNRESNIVDVENIDTNYFSKFTHPITGKPIELRYYQVDAVNAALENGGGVVVAGTGAGKTLMNAAVVDVYGKKGLKTITIVPSTDLIRQTRELFTTVGIDTGEYSGNSKDIYHQHVVSTWQALQNNHTIIRDFNVIIVDECHGIKTGATPGANGKKKKDNPWNVLTTILNDHGKQIPYRFGFTGTLPKEETNEMAIRITIGNPVYEIPAHELIKGEYLANLDIGIFQLEENLRNEYDFYLDTCNDIPPLTYIKFKSDYIGEWSAEKSYLEKKKERIEWIADFLEVKRDAKNGNTFCLVNSIQFGKKLAKLIPDAQFLYGKDDTETRKKAYDLFNDNNDIIVIASVRIAAQGLDIPRIFNLVFVDMGKSFIKTIQSIGRGLRKADDKDYVSVSDICSDLAYSKRHLTERLKYYKEAKYPCKKHVIKYEE